MNFYIDYKFELNGKEYEGFNRWCGDTIDTIEELKADLEGNKISAICEALDLTIDEFEERKEEFENVNFDYLEVYFN